jgi:lipopolysaccharide/colanic/teichoic acid biosynthesis glycosyltransferase
MEMGNAAEFMDEQTVKVQTKNKSLAAHNRLFAIIKRLVDILGSAVGLLILSPFFIYTAVRIPLDSPGPVLFHGKRAGKNGNPFWILKFRTMYETPESYNGSPITTNGDDRLTRFGAWLNHTKINEIPQLWNVFKGDMSFVGPRPEDYDIAMEWPKEIRDEILSVRPGITSPASVIYRNEKDLLSGSSVMDEYLFKILPEKQRLDQLYVRQQSLVGDLDVIFMTLIMLLPRLRNTRIPESQMYAGPIFRLGNRYISWFIVDTVTSLAAISIAGGLWRLTSPLDLGWGKAAGIAAFLAMSMSITNAIFGLRQIQWRNASPIYVFDLAISTVLSMMVFWLAGLYLLPAIQLPLPMLVDFTMFTFFGFVAVRYRERLVTGLASRWMRVRSQASLMGERVLIVGAGDCAQLAIWLIEKSKLAPAFSITGYVDDDSFKQGLKIGGYSVLGTTREIPQLVAEKNIGVVVFAINKVDGKNRERIIKSCQELSLRVIMIPDLLDAVSNYLAVQSRGEVNDAVA